MGYKFIVSKLAEDDGDMIWRTIGGRPVPLNAKTGEPAYGKGKGSSGIKKTPGGDYKKGSKLKDGSVVVGKRSEFGPYGPRTVYKVKFPSGKEEEATKSEVEDMDK